MTEPKVKKITSTVIESLSLIMVNQLSADYKLFGSAWKMIKCDGKNLSLKTQDVYFFQRMLRNELSN